MGDKMLTKHYSLTHADKVLKLVRKQVKCDGLIGVWANGREQGYHITSVDRAVVFAQQRNSDQIIVIYGLAVKFDISTHMPNDELWDRGRGDSIQCFDDDNVAAKAITEWIDNGVKPSDPKLTPDGALVK